MSQTTTQPATTTANIPEKILPASSRGYTMEKRGASNMAMGNGNPHKIPNFEDPYKKREWILEHMAGAFRVFGRKEFAEGTAGHISVRDPVDAKTFWINPLGVHFSMVTAGDMIHIDEDGNIIGGNTSGTINAAGFAIHSALHKARPNINAACHTHSVWGRAFSCYGKPLDMLNQDSCYFYKSHAVYEDFGGTAVEKEEGERIAKCVGETGRALIMQNHGLLTVGETVDEAAYLFTLLERTCKIQMMVNAAENDVYKKNLIGDSEAAYTNFISADPESMYMAFQPEYNLEKYRDDSFLQKSSL
jgi:ribulose-5-phosphate 4-epimerase/fuculose-1-phosphate aldolase